MNKRLSISYCLLITCFLILIFCALLISQLLKAQGTFIPINITTKIDDHTYYLSLHSSGLFFYLEKDIKNSSRLFMILKQNSSFLIYSSNGYYLKSKLQYHGVIYGSDESGDNLILVEREFGFFQLQLLKAGQKIICTNESYENVNYTVIVPQSNNFSNVFDVDFVFAPRLSNIFS